MQKITKDLTKFQTKQVKHSASELSNVVFTFMEDYEIDYKSLWGKRFMLAMMRLGKSNKSLLRRKIANAEEALQIMRTNEKSYWRNVHDNIMSSSDKKIKYFWNKILKSD